MHTFLKVFSPKVNVIVQMELELTTMSQINKFTITPQGIMVSVLGK